MKRPETGGGAGIATGLVALLALAGGVSVGNIYYVQLPKLALHMVTYFAGGALGTWTGAYAWSAWGGAGVSAAGAAFIAVALALWAVAGVYRRPA